MSGDADCDGVVDSLDARTILHVDVGFTDSVPCPDRADVDDDGRVGVKDAALVLQYDAGVIDRLG